MRPRLVRIGPPFLPGGMEAFMEFVADPSLSKRDKIIAGLLNLFGWVMVLISLGDVAIHYAIFPAPLSFYSLVACIIFTVIGSALVALSTVWPIGKPEWQAFVRSLLWPLVIRRRKLVTFAILAFWGVTQYQLTSLRSDWNMYVLPRAVENWQAKKLRSELAGKPTYPITVKVNGIDREALEFAYQLNSALVNAEWDAKVTEDTALGASGLTVQETGSANKPNPKDNPPSRLSQAFIAADIEVAGGSSVAAGTYSLSLIVGKRPTAMNRQPPLLIRLGEWITHMGAVLRQ